MTTAYHPQSNGIVERLHRRIKETLKARLAAATWPDHLPWVMLGIRVAPRDDSGVSAAKMVYAAPMCLPGVIIAAGEQPPEFFCQQFRAGLSAFSSCRPTSPPASSSASQLQQAQFV
jgi:transposase InsO family protein